MYFPPLDLLRRWAPFHIDALGIVTLLGASDVNLAVGTLIASPAEYLPVLAGNVIADNSFTKPIPGFVLYNITDGIVATDVAGWFSRWLICQHLTWSSTSLAITVSQNGGQAWSWRARRLSHRVLGLFTLSTLIILAILTGDWWGLANALSMLGGMVTREILVEQNRAALDAAAVTSSTASDSVVKVFCTLPSGEAITIYAPRLVVLNCILTTPVPRFKRLYSLLRGLAWLSFGGHVITLGLAALFNQLLTVVVLLGATVVLVQRLGTDQSRVGGRLHIQQTDHQGKGHRAEAYARLDLSAVEEDRMVQWNLFPHPTNTHWWSKYREFQALGTDQAFENWAEALASPV